MWWVVTKTTLTHTLGPPGPTTGGAVYTRWGRTTCPNTTGTQLLHAGRAAGSSHRANGGGANYICLPEQPQYSNYTTGAQSARAYLYGAEYETGYTSPGNVGVGPFSSFHDHMQCPMSSVSHFNARICSDDSCTNYLPIILDQGVLWISNGRAYSS